jgi:hypothetical protein
MKNMSFMLTTPQFKRGEKDVTRRVFHTQKRNPAIPVGWAMLEVGEHFSAVEKSQGVRKGESIKHLGQCICISNTQEPLNEIIKRPFRENGRSEMAREGFVHFTADQFVQFFCNEMKCHPGTMVNRIEFRKWKP